MPPEAPILDYKSPDAIPRPPLSGLAIAGFVLGLLGFPCAGRFGLYAILHALHVPYSGFETILVFGAPPVAALLMGLAAMVHISVSRGRRRGFIYAIIAVNAGLAGILF